MKYYNMVKINNGKPALTNINYCAKWNKSDLNDQNSD